MFLKMSVPSALVAWYLITCKIVLFMYYKHCLKNFGLYIIMLTMGEGNFSNECLICKLNHIIIIILARNYPTSSIECH